MKATRMILWFILTIALVVAGSYFATRAWGDKPETVEIPENLTVRPDMTLAEFKEQNELPGPMIKRIFGVEKREDLQKTLREFELDQDEIKSQVVKLSALASEEATKNWLKIVLKFALWILFMIFVFIMTVRKKIGPRLRWVLYLTGVILFGIALGSDPSPMGTVKDAVVLYGKAGIVFKPRLVAMLVFLFFVFVANKFICSWACQFGVLQDLIFRMNRKKKDKQPGFMQPKVSFTLTNAVRKIVFLIMCVAAIAWGLDIFEQTDPFKIFKPATLGIAGGAFILAILITSLFVYRPWCHLFCPFGLLGWLVEKISLYKIRVDYDKCVACGACEEACPSTVMSSILRRDREIADCFACSTCIDACPVDAISFDAKKRTKPPAGKFPSRS